MKKPVLLNFLPRLEMCNNVNVYCLKNELKINTHFYHIIGSITIKFDYNKTSHILQCVKYDCAKMIFWS